MAGHAASSTRSRPLWLRRFLVAATLLVPAAWVYADWFPSRLRISPETTVITAPLYPDGRPDYVTHLNRKYSEGITPENNAAVILVRVAGGSSIPEEVRQEFFAKLGIPVPGDEDRLIPWGDHIKELKFVGGREWELESVLTGVYLGDGVGLAAAFDPQDHWEVVTYLDRMQAPLDLLISGASREKYYIPLIAAPEVGLQADWKPELQGLKDWETSWRMLLALRCRLHLHRRQGSAAVEDALALLRLARHVGSLPVHRESRAAKLELKGLECCQEALLSGVLTRDDIGRLQRGIRELPLALDPVAMIDIGTRLNLLDRICGVQVKRPKEVETDRLRFGTDRNELLVRINLAVDMLRDAQRQPVLPERRLAVEKVRSLWTSDDYTLVNQVKDAMQQLRGEYKRDGQVVREAELLDELAEVSRELEAFDENEEYWILLGVAIALENHHLDQGHYPAQLRSLVPVYIGSIPADPFTGKPLEYTLQSNGYSLWSLGENGKIDLPPYPWGDHWFGHPPLE